VCYGQRKSAKFADKIGFFSKAKRDALTVVVGEFSGIALSKTDFVPHLAGFVRANAFAETSWLKRNNFDRLPRLRNSLSRLENIIGAEDFSWIKELATSDYLFDPIVEIADVGERKVYSLRVDSDCHSFVANGFVNHNTEVRMTRLASDVLADIEKETVDFNPNYDESLSEPSVLPTRIPNLLINGSDGIAVGMATKIPPHNLTEVVEATVALLRKPSMSVDELAQIVTGPDFPTGGFIYGGDELKRSYTTGRGIIQMRARAGIDRIGRGNTERDAIIVTEIPFRSTKRA
jgi:DNA gyrase subunit A